MQRFYEVEFLDTEQQKTIKNVVAVKSKAALYDLLAEIGFSLENIISIKSAFSLRENLIPLSEQLLLLIQVRALIDDDSANIGDIFAHWFKKSKPRYWLLNYMAKHHVSIVHFLRALGFSSIVIEIIQAGQSSAHRSDIFDSAIETLEEEIDTAKEMGNAIGTNITKLLFVVVILLLLPHLVSNLSGSAQQTSGVVDFLLWVKSQFVPMITIMALLVGLAIYFRERLFTQQLAEVYPFSLFFKIICLKNSIFLINILQPNHTAGIKHLRTIEQFVKVNYFAKAQGNILLTQMVEHNEGFAQSLTYTQLAPSLISGMQSFDRTAIKAQQLKTLTLLKKILKQEMSLGNKKLATFANTVAMLTLIAIVFILFFALFLPRIQSITNILN